VSSNKERLHQELEMCDELLNEEPNSKCELNSLNMFGLAFLPLTRDPGALLTKVFLMEELKEGRLGEANDILKKLEDIDPLRTNFYKDYRARLVSATH